MACDPAALRSRPRRAANPGRRAPGSATTVRCLHAEARLAEPAPELRRARSQAARGDHRWRARLEDYAQGNTLIVALTVTAVIEDAGAPAQPAPSCYCHEAVWVKRATAPQLLTDHLRALARRDFRTVAAALRNRGIQLSSTVDDITVELSLDPAFTAQLDAPPDGDSDPP